MASGTEIDPIHQFELQKVFEFKPFGLDLSFTNSSLWMIIAVHKRVGPRRPVARSVAVYATNFRDGIAGGASRFRFPSAP